MRAKKYYYASSFTDEELNLLYECCITDDYGFPWQYTKNEAIQLVRRENSYRQPACELAVIYGKFYSIVCPLQFVELVNKYGASYAAVELNYFKSLL